MINTFSLQQISRTSNLDANLISRQYKLNLMADFMRIKYENPKIKQSEIANQLGKSSSTLQRYRNDISLLSPYRINPHNTNKRTKNISNTIFDNISYPASDVRRPRLTSNDPKANTKFNKKNKHVLKAGSVEENIEINEHYLDEIFDENNLEMDFAMQIISYDKTVRNDTIQDLKKFNSQSLSTQALKGEQLVSMMPAIKKSF